jgi:putative Mn2+ efflux pump MntP
MANLICLTITILLGILGVIIGFTFGKPLNSIGKAQKFATLIGGVVVIVLSLVIIAEP